MLSPNVTCHLTGGLLCHCQDVTVLEDVVKMLLEIINSCLTAQLAHNPNLVYALLYKREAIQSCMRHAAFQDITHNIETVSRPARGCCFSQTVFLWPHKALCKATRATAGYC